MEYELELEPFEETEYRPERSEEHYFQAAAIGYRNTEYYLHYFERFNERGAAALSWHWPAFFFTFFWFLYRKMWGWALLYLLLPLPFATVLTALTIDFPQIQLAASAVYLAIAYLLFPLFANALYYRHINNKIAAVKRMVGEKELRLKTLASEGGTSRAMIGIVLLFVAAVASILSAYAIPSYNKYKSREVVERALSLGIEYQREVEAYAVRNQRWPRSLADIGAVKIGHVVEIDNVRLNNGTLFIRFTAVPPLEGKSLVLIPQLTDAGYVEWSCRGDNIAEIYLPPGCRIGAGW